MNHPCKRAVDGSMIPRSRREFTRRGALAALCLAAMSPACAGPFHAPTLLHTPVGAKEVSFKTADGWTIVGDLYAARPAHAAVVLLHQRGGSAEDFSPLCAALRAAGITALAIDQRGAGRSTTGPGPTGREAPWDTTGDIWAALRLLGSRAPIGLAGASYGANNSLIFAAAHPDKIRGVALFSPGANYNGLDGLAAARTYRGPIIIYHNQGDGIADDGPAQIRDSSPSHDKTLRIYQGSGHGTQLLNRETVADAVRFFRRTLR